MKLFMKKAGAGVPSAKIASASCATLTATAWPGGAKSSCHGLNSHLAWEPETGALSTVVNERDELGPDLVPDYLTSVRDGAFGAGRTAISASTSMRASSCRGRISLPRRSSRIR